MPEVSAPRRLLARLSLVYADPAEERAFLLFAHGQAQWGRALLAVAGCIELPRLLATGRDMNDPGQRLAMLVSMVAFVVLAPLALLTVDGVHRRVVVPCLRLCCCRSRSTAPNATPRDALASSDDDGDGGGEVVNEDRRQEPGGNTKSGVPLIVRAWLTDVIGCLFTTLMVYYDRISLIAPLVALGPDDELDGISPVSTANSTIGSNATETTPAASASGLLPHGRMHAPFVYSFALFFHLAFAPPRQVVLLPFIVFWTVWMIVTLARDLDARGAPWTALETWGSAMVLFDAAACWALVACWERTHRADFQATRDRARHAQHVQAVVEAVGSATRGVDAPVGAREAETSPTARSPASAAPPAITFPGSAQANHDGRHPPSAAATTNAATAAVRQRPWATGAIVAVQLTATPSSLNDSNEQSGIGDASTRPLARGHSADTQTFLELYASCETLCGPSSDGASRSTRVTRHATPVGFARDVPLADIAALRDTLQALAATAATRYGASSRVVGGTGGEFLMVFEPSSQDPGATTAACEAAASYARALARHWVRAHDSTALGVGVTFGPYTCSDNRGSSHVAGGAASAARQLAACSRDVATVYIAGDAVSLVARAYVTTPVSGAVHVLGLPQAPTASRAEAALLAVAADPGRTQAAPESNPAAQAHVLLSVPAANDDDESNPSPESVAIDTPDELELRTIDPDLVQSPRPATVRRTVNSTSHRGQPAGKRRDRGSRTRAALTAVLAGRPRLTYRPCGGGIVFAEAEVESEFRAVEHADSGRYVPAAFTVAVVVIVAVGALAPHDSHQGDATDGEHGRGVLYAWLFFAAALLLAIATAVLSRRVPLGQTRLAVLTAAGVTCLLLAALGVVALEDLFSPMNIYSSWFLSITLGTQIQWIPSAVPMWLPSAVLFTALGIASPTKLRFANQPHSLAEMYATVWLSVAAVIAITIGMRLRERSLFASVHAARAALERWQVQRVALHTRLQLVAPSCVADAACSCAPSSGRDPFLISAPRAVVVAIRVDPVDGTARAQQPQATVGAAAPVQQPQQQPGDDQTLVDLSLVTDRGPSHHRATSVGGRPALPDNTQQLLSDDSCDEEDDAAGHGSLTGPNAARSRAREAGSPHRTAGIAATAEGLREPRDGTARALDVLEAAERELAADPAIAAFAPFVVRLSGARLLAVLNADRAQPSARDAVAAADARVAALRFCDAFVLRQAPDVRVARSVQSGALRGTLLAAGPHAAPAFAFGGPAVAAALERTSR